MEKGEASLLPVCFILHVENNAYKDQREQILNSMTLSYQY
jgi:hypothetical protein